ncbi:MULTISPECIES: HRDC domain-containing protein [unclassified Schaalia]|uniref:HRDC domain-containing protein n=1 Tax=unclassified Schaalia TaxID=2691889 RepID=UPI001E508520|nr:MULTISPECIES: HRDC domain-containing protein [unclassified Schaalia]MCD4549471.1 HRDC domain-containing protein [Schaalia sp. lx-260]MCD4558032.1 HRDC domain-containing protein [Schaalia sp. lx-100]
MTPPTVSSLPPGNFADPVLITEPRGGIPQVIDTPEALAQAAQTLAQGRQPIALDVERAQGFRYGTDPYLIQIRREDAGLFLIDSHALPDLSSLAPALHTLWILHAADQDLPNLRHVNLEPTDIFDTEIAARLLGYERFGLAAVCERTLGLTMLKDHQAANWSVRPLPPDWLRYASLDVELLTELYIQLSHQLHDMHRWEWAQQEFTYIRHQPPHTPKKDRWRTLPGAGKIRDRRGLALLRALWETRERLAKSIDIAPTLLVRNSALIRAAQYPPRNKRALHAIAEFRSPKAREYSDEWMRAITSVKTLKDCELPLLHPTRDPASIPEARNWKRIDPAAYARLIAVRAAVQSVAEPQGIAAEIVLAPKVQRWLAWAPYEGKRPLSEAITARFHESDARPWQKELTMSAIITALCA